MRIGIIYDDIYRENLNCSKPFLGNPGVGGTQYCYLMLLYFMKEIHPEHDIIVYRYKKYTASTIMPQTNTILYKNCGSIIECAERAADDKVDILLFTVNHLPQLIDIVNQRKIPSIVWIHNWIRGDVLELISDCDYVRRAVFLVEEHRDRYIDHSIIGKAVVIPNMFDITSYSKRDIVIENNVTYVGGLIKSKGFHSLAKAWKKVVKLVPDAKLHVLGTGDLYGDGAKAGPLGVASEEYEQSFLKYITDENGKLLSSVHFEGLVGEEKMDFYKNTKVGVVNPTGATEVCPISALEMEGAGIPVISKHTNGLPNVIKNNKTGLLIKRESELADAIVLLLRNDSLNVEYGTNAREYIGKEFNPERIIELWVNLFLEAQTSTFSEIVLPRRNLCNNMKFLRILNYKVKQIRIFQKVPAVVTVEDWVSKKIRGI